MKLNFSKHVIVKHKTSRVNVTSLNCLILLLVEQYVKQISWWYDAVSFVNGIWNWDKKMVFFFWWTRNYIKEGRNRATTPSWTLPKWWKRNKRGNFQNQKDQRNYKKDGWIISLDIRILIKTLNIDFLKNSPINWLRIFAG